MSSRLYRVPPTLLVCTKRLLVTALLVVLLVSVSGCAAQLGAGRHIPTTTAVHTPTPENSFPCIPDNSVQTALVTKIVDGDTVWVRIDGKSYKVRYIGMNTPEIGEAGADAAIALNSSLVMGKTVQLYKDTSETGKYGRLLRYVVVDGIFVNYELVAQDVAEPGTWKPDTACDDFMNSAYLQRQYAAVIEQKEIFLNIKVHLVG